MSDDELTLKPGERLSHSGRVILPPREEGHLVLVCQLEPGLQFNVACSGEEDTVNQEAAELAAKISAAQLLLERGKEAPVLELQEPVYGWNFQVTRAGLRRILSVMPGYAQRVDPSVLVKQAEMRRAGERMQQAAMEQARIQSLAQRNGRPRR